MARQTRTQAEIDQVNNDFDTFQLPIDASLNLGEFAAYGATDNAIDLSLVNIRHLNSTRDFRGTWTSAPVDGNVATPYTAGQVVIGSDMHLYRLTSSGNGGTDPVAANQSDWDQVGGALNDEFSVQGAVNSVNPTVRFQQGSHTAMDVQFTSSNMNIVKTADRVITFDATHNPGLNASPSSLMLPAYARTAFTTTVSSHVGGTITGTPTVASTMANTIIPLNSLAITGNGVVTGTAVNPEANAEYTITATANIQDSNVSGVIYDDTTLDIPVTFEDRRAMPTVSPTMLSVPSVGTFTDAYTLDLTPMGSVADGLAYDINSTGITAAGNAVTGTSYIPTGFSAGQTINFAFPNVASSATNQPTGTITIPVMLEVFQPFFYGAAGTIPSTITGLTRSTTAVPGSTPTEITITGGAGDPIYIVVPSTVNSVTTQFGAAMVPGARISTADIVVPGNNGQMFTYHTYVFGSLFGSSVILNLLSS